MANNYPQFSEIIKDLTDEEIAWIGSIPQELNFSDDEKYVGDSWVAPFREALNAHGIQVDADDKVFDDDFFPRFEFEIDSERRQWWLFSQEDYEEDHLVRVMQAFLAKFRPDGVFKVTTSATCSRPRVGEFGGAWLVLTKDHYLCGNTWLAADDAVKRLQMGDVTE